MDFCTGDTWSIFKRCPFIDILTNKRNWIESKYENIVEYIIEAINLESYILVSLDWYYIPMSEVYHKKHIMHEVLIYRYDDIKKILYIADFLNNYRYDQYKCNYDDIINAYSNYVSTSISANIMKDIYTIQVNNNITHTFDIRFYKVLLCDYINSCNSNLHFYPINSKDFIDDDSFVYGISIYNELIKYLNACHDNSVELSMRTFHILYEHKKNFLESLKYIINLGLCKD